MNLRYFLFLIILFGIVFFYLRQQIEITKIQYKIKDTFDKISILDIENKQLSVQIESLKSYARLEEFATKNNFIKPNFKEIKIVYYKN